MSTQRRVTAPPGTKAEVVTNSLRSECPGTPPGAEIDPIDHTCTVPASPNKENSLVASFWTTRLCPGFLADLVLPGVPGVGVLPL
jgi:hypothetical protein